MRGVARRPIVRVLTRYPSTVTQRIGARLYGVWMMGCYRTGKLLPCFDRSGFMTSKKQTENLEDEPMMIDSFSTTVVYVIVK
jgi:hypothetical protein